MHHSNTDDEEVLSRASGPQLLYPLCSCCDTAKICQRAHPVERRYIVERRGTADRSSTIHEGIHDRMRYDCGDFLFLSL